jgi:S-adenosylmethionine decarboxylase
LLFISRKMPSTRRITDYRNTDREDETNMGERLKLYGFNNLTKSLSFNIYDVCYAKSAREQQDYIAYIDEQYNSERLTHILTALTDQIGAQVLNIARQDYEPQGASVTLLIAEAPMLPRGEVQLGHLDKSHVTVHTYPEFHPKTSLATFRVDIDVATCGEITPLSTLDYLIGSFDSDIITIDYRVRGFTRAEDGQKLFMDHKISSIQNYIDPATLRRYDAMDLNVYSANLFHTRMMIKEIDLQNYLFKTDVYELPPQTRLEIMTNLRREMIEIFNG